MAKYSNKMLISFYLIFIFFLTTFSIPSLSEICLPEEKETLLQIKNGLGNPDVLSSWDPQTDCCDWEGVGCQLFTRRVLVLTIENGTYRATIPPQVGDLQDLRVLMFRYNRHLRGPIPPEIAKLRQLSSLIIEHTRISGEIPQFIGEMTSLEYVLLASNNLTGPIPANLANIPYLWELNLHSNELTGPIPDTFGRFRNPYFIDLYLSHNKLSGEIPASLGDQSFRRLDLSQNDLEGDATMLFGKNKTRTWFLHLSRNFLSFNLSAVTFPPSLVDLDISHNNIFGSLPQELTELNLSGFNASYNNLCGEIPLGGQLQNFDVSAYSHNLCLCGPPLPQCDSLALPAAGQTKSIF